MGNIISPKVSGSKALPRLPPIYFMKNVIHKGRPTLIFFHSGCDEPPVEIDLIVVAGQATLQHLLRPVPVRANPRDPEVELLDASDAVQAPIQRFLFKRRTWHPA